MNYKYFGLTTLILGSFGSVGASVSSHAPVEFRNDRKDLQVMVRTPDLSFNQAIPGGGYTTASNLQQQKSLVAEANYTIKIKKTGGTEEQSIDIKCLFAPSAVGNYVVGGINMPQDSLVAFLDTNSPNGAIRANLWGNSAMGEKALVERSYSVNQTNFKVKMEVIFESFYRKVKVYIQ